MLLLLKSAARATNAKDTPARTARSEGTLPLWVGILLYGLQWPNVSSHREANRWPNYFVRAGTDTDSGGEFWWTEGKYQWVFFDDVDASEAYAEQVERCPACGRRLERKNLSMAVTPAG
jgi:hypothetical protein